MLDFDEILRLNPKGEKSEKDSCQTRPLTHKERYSFLDQDLADRVIIEAEEKIKKQIEDYPDWDNYSFSYYGFKNETRMYYDYIKGLDLNMRVSYRPYEYGSPRDCGMGGNPETISFHISRK